MIWFIQIAGIIGFFVCLVVMYLTPYGVHGIRAYDPTFQMPDMKFHYSVEQITQAFERIGANGRELYQKYLVLDCIFVFCFGILMLTITNRLFTGSSRNILLVICVLRGIFDILENILLIVVLRYFPMANTQLVSLCSYFTTLKFIMLYIWILATAFQVAQFGIIKMMGK